MNEIVTSSIIIYIFLLIVVFILKPKFIYNKYTNDLKQYGFNKHETIFPYVLFCAYAAIIIFLICCIYIKY
jgi:hypothetical protein